MNSILDDLIESIGIEISELKKSRKKKYINVEFYKKISELSKEYLIYEIYVSEYVSKMVEDLEIELTSVKHKVSAKIISVDENQIIKIKLKEPLTEEIYKINMEFDPSFLLVALSKSIEIVKDTDNPIVKNLLNRISADVSIEIDVDNIEYDHLNQSQINAIKNSEKKQISLIWGPPGTGKTHTLAKIIFRSYLRDERILVLSTSNVALDHILLNLDSDLYDDEKDNAVRLGNTNNHTAYRYTKDFKPYKDVEKNIVFSTLANLSTKYKELGDFDLVVIDEASMVSLPYIFVAANKSKRNMIILGDFRQLPPISLNEANSLFQLSIFEYLEIPKKIDKKENVSYMTMLDTQYRMSEKISYMISSLFYNGLLKCGVESQSTTPLNFINVDDSSYGSTYFSITDISYFNPLSVGIISQLLDNEIHSNKSVLIVSPFRPQQNMLNALTRDKNLKFGRSLTVHKAQGSEADVVIFDLTTHVKVNKENFHKFFVNDIAKNLVNVAMSRTKEQLYIIGSIKMIENLSKSSKLWDDFLKIINRDFTILNSLDITNQMEEMNTNDTEPLAIKNFTVVDAGCDKIFYDLIKSSEAIKRNYVAYEGCIKSEDRREITFRDMKQSDKLPNMAFLDDKILLKENNVYRFASLEKTSKVLQRIALESYIDTYEVDRVSTYTLNCDRCGGNFMLQNNGGYTVLSCPTCHNTKHIGKNEALLLKDLYKIKCPDCNADVIPRTKNGHSNYSFYGCSNYPHCMGQVPMYSIAKGY